MEKEKSKIFISFSSKDRDLVLTVKNLLVDRGFSCWMAPESIPCGSDYASVITNAIKECKFFLAFVSDNFQESIWTRKEIDIALNNNLIIIPWQLNNVKFNNAYQLIFANIQRLLAYEDFEYSFDKLLETLNNHSPTQNNLFILDYSEIEYLISQKKYISAEKIILEELKKHPTDGYLHLLGLFTQLEITSIDMLTNVKRNYKNYPYYKNAIKYLKGELADKLKNATV